MNRRRRDVDAGRVFEIGAVRILMALAEAHHRLVRPGIVVEHRISMIASRYRLGFLAAVPSVSAR